MTVNRRNRPVELTDALVQRSIPIGRLEVRADPENDDIFTIEGYASTFEPYEMYGGPADGGWIEQVDPHAFDVTLSAKPDLHLLLNHDGGTLARTKSGTCELSVDDIGLKVLARLDKRDPDSMSVFVKMERHDLTEMSFAFRVKAQEWTSAPGFDDGDSMRILTEISLHKGDVSVVNFGANPDTSVGIRSVDDALKIIAECDAELVEARSGDDVLRKAQQKLGAIASVEDTVREDDSTESDVLAFRESLLEKIRQEVRDEIAKGLPDVLDSLTADTLASDAGATVSAFLRALESSDIVDAGRISGPTGTLLDGVVEQVESNDRSTSASVEDVATEELPVEEETPSRGMSLRLALALAE